jgi:hypothetical protein
MKGHIGSALSRMQSVVAAIIFSVLTGCGGGGSSSANSSLSSSNSSSANSSTSSAVSSSSSSSSSSLSLSKVSISGTLLGNAGNVTLSLNSQQQLFSGSSFIFPQKLNQGENYAVTFISESTNSFCTVKNGSGVAQTNITNIEVTCLPTLSILRFDAMEVLGDLTTGDFNGDGLADLALTTRTYPEHPAGSDRHFTKFLLGDGAGNFSQENDVETILLGVTNQRGHQSVAADFNGDGFDDYVLYNEVYLGNANGVPTRSFVATDYPGTSLIAQDINGDGHPDILGNTQQGSLAMYFGLQTSSGDGTFSPVTNFSTRAQMDINWIFGMANYTLADINGDDKLDIIAFAGSGTNVKNLVLRILPAHGDGTFDVTGSTIDLPDDLDLDDDVLWDYAKEITSGDFDGDGDIDLAITSDTNFVQIMLNDGAGTFSQSQRVMVGTQPIHIDVADFNLDGKPDLVTANAKSNTIHVSYGKGDGTFGDNTGAADGWVSVGLERNVTIYDMVLADFDGDGAPDIAIAEDGSNSSGSGRGSVQIVFASGL